MDADLRTRCSHGTQLFQPRSAQAGDGSERQNTARCRLLGLLRTADRIAGLFFSVVYFNKTNLARIPARRGPRTALGSWVVARRGSIGPSSAFCLIIRENVRFILRVMCTRPGTGTCAEPSSSRPIR